MNIKMMMDNDLGRIEAIGIDLDLSKSGKEIKEILLFAEDSLIKRVQFANAQMREILYAMETQK